MSRIKELPKSSAHLLSSTQIITSVHSVVKELIENSLDSSSKNVEIKLEDYGLEKIEVKDNGNGIYKDDIHFVAKPHCTSKILSHLDLDKIETYGFRGEALSALCAVSDFAITTKTASEDLGFTYVFDHKGDVLTSKPCPCTQGTVVTALNLFKNIPVRKQLYRSSKNKKEELRKIEDILISFSCIHSGVRFVLYHNRSLIWQKSAVNKTSEALLQVFGNSVFEHMENCEYTDDETQINIEVFLPTKNAPKVCGQSSPSRSIVSINKRPVRMKMIDKLLKEYYSRVSESGGNSCYPICYISINTLPADVDINFEPNKTAVSLRNGDLIVDQLSKILSTFYSVESNPESNSITKTTSSVSTLSCTETGRETSSHKNATQERERNSSKESNQENEVPLVQMQQSQFIPRFQSIVSKENKVTSSKLSRNNSSILPSSKRVKTSSSFSTPPNDILRHIKTMDSFFTSTEKDEAKSAAIETPIGNKTPFAVTVQRENSVVENGEVNHAGSNVVAASICNQAHSAITMQKDTSNVEPILEGLKSPMRKDSVNFSPETSVRRRHTSDSCLQILNQDHFNQSSSSMINTFNIDKWSRGIHPVEQTPLQPVVVLKPKIIESNQNVSKNIKTVENLDGRRESNDLSPNQRKITPFDFFCRKHRLEVASLNPDMSNQQLAQILTEKWDRLSPEEKALYKNMVPKEYPKNIKNKDKLGNSISQNLDKGKPASVKTKKTKKMKPKIVDKTIPFNMEKIKNSYYSECCSENGLDNMAVINSIAPGIWICLQGNKLYLLNSFRLQETIVYHRLLETYHFQTELLESPYLISNGLLDDDDIHLLLQLDHTNDHGNEIMISDKKLTANGFEVRMFKSDMEIQVEIVAMTVSIAFYGAQDMKEILALIKEKGILSKLSDCRPSKVVLYLQGEASRIARQCPASKKLEDIDDLLKERESLSSDRCIHSKPFLYELCSISTGHSPSL